MRRVKDSPPPLSANEMGRQMQYRDGMEYERRCAVAFLREAGDHITSGDEAADCLEQGEHHR